MIVLMYNYGKLEENVLRTDAQLIFANLPMTERNLVKLPC